MRNRSNSGSSLAVDIDALRAAPALVDQLDGDDLLAVLDRCTEERDRLALVERHVHTRLRHVHRAHQGTDYLLVIADAAPRTGG